MRKISIEEKVQKILNNDDVIKSKTEENKK